MGPTDFHRGHIDEEMLVRTALNTISEDWEVFVRSILDRSKLPDWKELWVALRTKATPARAEKEVEEDDDCAMSAHVPLEKKWGDIEL